MEIVDKYIIELEEDLKLDSTSLEDKTMKVPGIKGKWLSRLIKHKREVKKCEVLMDEAKTKLIKEYEKNSDVAFSKATLEKIVMDHEVLRKIKNNIDNEKLAIEFCDRSLSIVSSVTYDIKNILEGYKLELT